MYIRAYTGFGDPQPAPPADTPLLKKAPPFLVISRISPFAVDKPALMAQSTQPALTPHDARGTLPSRPRLLFCAGGQVNHSYPASRRSRWRSRNNLWNTPVPM